MDKKQRFCFQNFYWFDKTKLKIKILSLLNVIYLNFIFCNYFISVMRIDGVEISDEQVDEFKEAFAEFDINSDGTITSQELGKKSIFFVSSRHKSQNFNHFSCWRHGNKKSGRRNSNWRGAETNGSRSRSGGIQRMSFAIHILNLKNFTFEIIVEGWKWNNWT